MNKKPVIVYTPEELLKQIINTKKTPVIIWDDISLPMIDAREVTRKQNREIARLIKKYQKKRNEVLRGLLG